LGFNPNRRIASLVRGESGRKAVDFPKALPLIIVVTYRLKRERGSVSISLKEELIKKYFAKK
jgi:hypothetical protein